MLGTDSIINFFHEHKLHTVFELHIAEVFREVFSSIRNKTLDLNSAIFSHRRVTRSSTKGKMTPLYSKTSVSKFSITNKLKLQFATRP